MQEDKKSADRYLGRRLWCASPHHDWITALLHLPELNSLLTASLDKQLCLTDTERRIAIKTLTGGLGQWWHVGQRRARVGEVGGP